MKLGPWANAVLFVATLLSTFLVGLTWSASYITLGVKGGDPLVNLELAALADSRVLGLAAAYTAVLMAILLAHEFGHYLTCRRYGIAATLPFFIPAPTLVGTLGAFIRIKAPITRKKVLFDIGANGPLAGFVLALPALVVGLALSKVVPALPKDQTIVFGDPLLLKIFGRLLLGEIPAGSDIIIHPIGFAGWVGCLVTALNLFPVGQLDGGHLAYAIFGRRTRAAGRAFIGLFVVLAFFFWAGWLVWAAVLLFLGLKHPSLADEEEPLDGRRRLLAVVLLVIFIFSFIPDPVKGFSGIGLLRQVGLFTTGS
jgi:membrane-associated protease RseP (regulator of RpoE activity)